MTTNIPNPAPSGNGSRAPVPADAQAPSDEGQQLATLDRGAWIVAMTTQHTHRRRLSRSFLRSTAEYRDALFDYGDGSITWSELLGRFRALRDALRIHRKWVG